MAHKEQSHFVWEVWQKFPQFFKNTKVLEIGSLIVNTPAISRDIFTNCEYIGIDIMPGPGVDVVCLGHLYNAPDETFDMVMSCECFEHDMYYEKTISNMVRLLKPGGIMFFTCASTGRPEHGTKNSTPEDSPFTSQIKDWDDYYKNLTETDIRNIPYFSENMHGHYFATSEYTCDLYYHGWKNHK